MVKIKIDNDNYHKAKSHVTAGDTIILAEGDYTKPLILHGISGTAERPVTIRPSKKASPGAVIFKSGLDPSKAKVWANKAAAKRQYSGYYPTFAHLGDQAMLILKDCKYVIIRGLDFEDCWPTAIYLDNSNNIVIHDVHFRGGTLAIGANGIDAHDVIVQHCHWKQDQSPEHTLWNTVPWDRIHGAKNNSPIKGVDINKDFRKWDGDFLRGWNVGSNFVIRNNRIEDAFNAIHFFNTFDRLSPGAKANNMAFNGGRQSTANVIIENNEFVRIRDNVFEPEYHAWNWIIRHNHIFDCYRPFSFEFERAGWFYIYGNTGSFVHKPSQNLSAEDQGLLPPSKRRGTPSLFKPKGKQANEGPIYVFNNSWYFKVGKGLFPKYSLGSLFHFNNAIKFRKADKGRFFGGRGDKLSPIPKSEEQERIEEEARFTRRWQDYNIKMDGDVTNDSNFPHTYRNLGYSIGSQAVQAEPEFADIPKDEFSRGDFTSTADQIIGKAISFTMEYPDGSYEMIREKHNIGAVQDVGWYADFDQKFKFVPDETWVPSLPDARPFPRYDMTS